MTRSRKKKVYKHIGGAKCKCCNCCNKKRKKQKGGAVSLEFTLPKSQNTSALGEIKSVINKQKLDSENVSRLKNTMSGGAIVIPQMSQAGSEGNSLIKNVLDQQLKARAAAEFDSEAQNIKPQGITTKGGRRKKRTKRKRRRKKRTKKRRKLTRRKSRRKK